MAPELITVLQQEHDLDNIVTQLHIDFRNKTKLKDYLPRVDLKALSSYRELGLWERVKLFLK